MIDHLGAIKTAVDTARQAGQSALTAAELDCFHARYLQIVETRYAQNPAPEPPNGPQRRDRGKQSKARNLLHRFRDHPEGILAFMRDFAVPFDNNLSERDLRMMKLRQKISGTFRGIACPASTISSHRRQLFLPARSSNCRWTTSSRHVTATFTSE